MPTREVSGVKVWRQRTTRRQFAVWLGWLTGVAIFAYCWKLISDRTIWAFVSDSPRQAADMAERMVPPKWSYMEVLWAPVWDTINITTQGTMISIVIAMRWHFARRAIPPRVFTWCGLLHCLLLSHHARSIR